MGQQQLTLIVLGVILTALAFVVGLTMVNGYAYTANKDAVRQHLSFLGTNAQQYYKRSVNIGGPFFTGYAIPAGLNDTPDGTFVITALAPDGLTIAGTGTVTAGGQTVQLRAVITPVSITISENPAP